MHQKLLPSTVIAFLLCSGTVVWAVSALRSNGASSAIPTWLNYQGRITTPDKAAVADGQYDAVFKIFDSPTGGTLLWSESDAVAAIDDVFNTTLGQSTAFPPDLFTQRLWLQTEIEGRTLVPRQELGAVAYAMTAQTAMTLPPDTVDSSMIIDRAIQSADLADSSIASTKLADGAVTNTKIADVSVTASKISGGAVGLTQLDDLSVSTAKILSGAITTEKLLDGAVTPAKLSGIKMYGLGPHLTGTGIPARQTGEFLFQGGTHVASAPTFTVVFPQPFPGGVLTVVAVEGDTTGFGNIELNACTKTGFQVNSTQSGLIRVNWIAIGW